MRLESWWVDESDPGPQVTNLDSLPWSDPQSDPAADIAAYAGAINAAAGEIKKLFQPLVEVYAKIGKDLARSFKPLTALMAQKPAPNNGPRPRRQFDHYGRRRF
jgi:hypothetical protein